MNLKAAVLGGLAFYIATFLVSMVTGPLLHEGMLNPIYREHMAFWRPELMATPPDMAALLPRWLATGLVLGFVLAGIYAQVRPVIAGRGWVRGAKYGFWAWLIATAITATWTGIFNLPDILWFWWALEGLGIYVLGGAAIGFVADRWAGDARSA